jgi:hypothetical protein
MSFNVEDCEGRMWCGSDAKIPLNKIKGDSYSCMRRGFGKGAHVERTKLLDPSDLRTVPYMNQYAIEKLAKYKVTTKPQFLSMIVRLKNPQSTKKLLEQIVPENPKAFNGIVLFLYNSNINPQFLPTCVKI